MFSKDKSILFPHNISLIIYKIIAIHKDKTIDGGGVKQTPHFSKRVPSGGRRVLLSTDYLPIYSPIWGLYLTIWGYFLCSECRKTRGFIKLVFRFTKVSENH